MSDIPNVIVLLIDGLGIDGLGFHGRNPTPSPALDAFFEQSFVANRMLGCGAPTQFAMPGLMTSTLPLDCGGYDFGIRDRPRALAEVFQKAGYRTGAFTVPCWMDAVFGYARGFDTHLPLHDATMIINSIMIYAEFYAGLIRKGRLTLNAAVDHFYVWCADVVEALYSHCVARTAEQEGGSFPLSSAVHNSSIPCHLQTAESLLAGDARMTALRVIEAALEGRPLAGERQLLERKGVSMRRQSARRLARSGLLDKVQGCCPEAEELVTRLVGKVRVPTADYVFEVASQWISRQRGKPFFSYLHFLDVHDRVICSFDSSTPEALGDEQAALLDFLGREKIQDDSAAALSLRYFDHQFARFMAFLERERLADNTILLVISDHGDIDRGGGFNRFPWVRYRVPFAMRVPGVAPHAFNSLSTSLDIAPTLLTALGMSPEPGFKGRSLLEPGLDGQPHHALMEHHGRGPCLWGRPVNIGVTDGAYHLERRVQDRYDLNARRYRIDGDKMIRVGKSVDSEGAAALKSLRQISDARLEAIQESLNPGSEPES